MGKIRIDNGYVRLCLFCAAGLAIGIGVRLIVDMLSNMEHSISWNGGEYFGEETATGDLKNKVTYIVAIGLTVF